MITLSPKDPAEAIYYGIDFAANLGTGETISSATASIRVTSGTDASAAAMLSGAAVIDGSIVKQKLINGVAGCTYQFGLTVVTSAGQTLVEGAPLRVIERD
jgi:hypothetical protein